MDTNQIYSIVNDAVAQAIGDDALASIDTKNFVSLVRKLVKIKPKLLSSETILVIPVYI